MSCEILTVFNVFNSMSIKWGGGGVKMKWGKKSFANFHVPKVSKFYLNVIRGEIFKFCNLNPPKIRHKKVNLVTSVKSTS